MGALPSGNKKDGAATDAPTEEEQRDTPRTPSEEQRTAQVFPGSAPTAEDDLVGAFEADGKFAESGYTTGCPQILGGSAYAGPVEPGLPKAQAHSFWARYRLGGPIGQGSFGFVLNACAIDANLLPAKKEDRYDIFNLGVKLFKKTKKAAVEGQTAAASKRVNWMFEGQDPEMMALTVRELRRELRVMHLMRAHNHAHINHLLQVYETADMLYLVFERARMDLRRAISKRFVKTYGDIQHAMRGVGQGLRYMHSLNPPLAHLDLKPANIVIDRFGVIKIIDFGATTPMLIPAGGGRGGMRQNMLQWCPTTYEFAGPEAIRAGTPKPYPGFGNYYPTTQSDVWSMGAIMWFCLAVKLRKELVYFEMLGGPHARFYQWRGAYATELEKGLTPDKLAYVNLLQGTPEIKAMRQAMEAMLKKEPDERLTTADLLQLDFFKDPTAGGTQFGGKEAHQLTSDKTMTKMGRHQYKKFDEAPLLRLQDEDVQNRGGVTAGYSSDEEFVGEWSDDSDDKHSRRRRRRQNRRSKTHTHFDSDHYRDLFDDGRPAKVRYNVATSCMEDGEEGLDVDHPVCIEHERLLKENRRLRVKLLNAGHAITRMEEVLGSVDA